MTDAAVVLAEELLGRSDLPGTPARVATAAVLARAVELLGDRLGDRAAAATAALSVAEELAAAAGEPLIVARATYLRANGALAAGDLTGALALIDDAALAFRESGAHGAALRTNLGRANVLNELGRHDEALRACDDLLHGLASGPPADLDREAVVALGAAAQQNRGLCLELTGRWADALEAYSRAEAAFARLGDTASIGEILNNRGLVLLALGRISEARGAFTDAIGLLDEPAARALALHGLAEVLLARGEYVACLETVHQAQQLLARLDAPLPELDGTIVAAHAYEALNLHREALGAYREAAEFFGGDSSAVESARAAWGAARVRSAMGDSGQALAALDDVIEAFRRSGHGQWLAHALLDRSAVHAATGAGAAALADAHEAVVVSTASGARVEHVLAELAVARLSGSGAAAEAALARAAEARRGVDLAPLTLLVTQARGVLHLARGDDRRARDDMELAASIAEDLLGELDTLDVGRRFMLDKLEVFDGLVELEWRGASARPGPETAAALLRSTERARRSRFGDLRPRRGGVDPTAVTAADGAARDLDAIYTEMLTPGHRDAVHMERLGERALALELEVSRSRIAARASRVGAGDDASIGTSAELPVIDETVVAWYCLGDRILAVVLRDGLASATVLGASRQDVDDAVSRLDAQWRHLHADPGMLSRHRDRFVAACRSVLAELHDQLVGPIAHLLPTTPGAPLVVAPHGPLLAVPVHALHDGTSYLIERYTISTTPSLDDFVWRSRRKTARTGSSLVVAASDATTPAVTTEGHAVAAHLGDVTLHVGEAAIVGALQRGAREAPVVHIACHALFRRDNPMFSTLHLADRPMRADELLALDLDGALVTLSACDSGRSHAGHGEELVGLVRSVLGAGARTLVASLWPADDAATASLMDDFYRHLRDLGPADALRRAQLAALRVTPHPYHWAPFVTIGAR